MKEYPRFKIGEAPKLLAKLPKKDKEIMEEFGKYCSISAGRNKVVDMQRDVLRLRLVVSGFDKIDLKALRNFLYLMEKSELTRQAKNNAKIHIQKFLRWKFKDWSVRFDEFNDIKTKSGFDEEKINSKNLLTKEEVEKIVKKENSLFWKSYFLTQYEGALRTKETRNIKWEDLRFNVDGDISELHIYSTKNKRARVVYLKEASFYLKRLKEETERNSPFVFPSIYDDSKPLSKYSVSRWFKNHASKVVGRKVWAYILRHSRGTELYLNAEIPNKVAQKFMGHNKDMADIYTHLSKEDVKSAMSKVVYKLEELPEEKKHELLLRLEKLEKENKEMQPYYLEVKKWKEGVRNEAKQLLEEAKKEFLLKLKVK